MKTKDGSYEYPFEGVVEFMHFNTWMRFVWVFMALGNVTLAVLGIWHDYFVYFIIVNTLIMLEPLFAIYCDRLYRERHSPVSNLYRAFEEYLRAREGRRGRR